MGLEEEEQHICAICHQEITGGAMRTRNKLYCEDSCFNCSACQRSLKNVSVFTKDDLLYCEEHYKAKFVPKCAKCDDYITENCIRALDRSWHSRCFGCGGCDLNFSSNDVGYHENEGQAYCEKCYTNMVLPKCQSCQEPITDRAMKAMGGQWHVTCFVCKDCHCTFEGQKSFYAIDDQPVCGPCAGIGEEEED